MNGGDLDAIEDLSSLTDVEQSMVLEVLRRDEELRQQESTRIEILKSEVEALKQRLATNESDGSDRGRKCSLCSASFGWIFSRGDTCLRCQETKVCDRCRYTTSTSEGGWVCLLCHKIQQLYLKSGSWFHRTISGRRRLRRLTESESSTLTFHKDVERNSSNGMDDGALSTTKCLSPNTLRRTKEQKVQPTPNTLTGDGCTGHLLIPGQTDRCVYPDENDRELLMLLTRNLKMKDGALSTDVSLTPRQSHESVDLVARRNAESAKALRSDYRVAHAQQCLSDEYPEWLLSNGTRGLRSYRTLEDLSSNFKDNGFDSANVAYISDEISEAKPAPGYGSCSNASKVSQEVCLQNETGDCIRQEANVLCRNESGNETSIEEHMSNEFHPLDLIGAERKPPVSKGQPPVSKVQPPVSKGQPPATNDSGSNSSSSSWLGEASLEELSSENQWHEGAWKSTDRSRSGAENLLASSLPEDLNSRTLDIDLDLLAWKAEIEQLFHEHSLMNEQDWEEEINSLGIVRDMVVWNGSDDSGKGAGTDPLLGNCVLFLPPSEDESAFVAGEGQQVAVEVAEERRMRLLSHQPRCFLPVLQDEDSLSIISERTEPTGSDHASVDLDLPASEAVLDAGWPYGDTLDTSDEDSPGITLTDAGDIDTAIDRIVKVEVQLCPSPCDLDTEMNRLVATNRQLLSRTFEKSTTTEKQMDKPNATLVQSCEHAVSSFHCDQELNDNGTTASSACESFAKTNVRRSPESSSSSESSMHISTSYSKPGAVLLSRYGDLDDATTPDPISNLNLTVNNHRRLINIPQELQPPSDSPDRSSHKVTEAEHRILDSSEQEASSKENANGSTRTQTRTKFISSKGELFSDAIESASTNISELDCVHSVDEKTKELGKGISDSFTREESHSSDASKNEAGEENQNNTGGVSLQ